MQQVIQNQLVPCHAPEGSHGREAFLLRNLWKDIPVEEGLELSSPKPQQHKATQVSRITSFILYCCSKTGGLEGGVEGECGTPTFKVMAHYRDAEATAGEIPIYRLDFSS